MALMKRIYHPYTDWEEDKAGMWLHITGEQRQKHLGRAIEFTGNHVLYGQAMLRVTREWVKSCEHNLTDTGMNRRAWIGHAACCLAIGCPEDITREAWAHLTQKQQDDANQQADNAIRLWERKHQIKNQNLYRDLGEKGVSKRDSRRSAVEPGVEKQGRLL